MPTARPIIIEKFMDHTDSGVPPPQVQRGEPDGDAGQRQQQRDAGGDGRTERDEQQDHASGGRTAARRGAGPPRCSSLKSCHTAHSPVTFAVAPVGQRLPVTWSITLPAGLRRSASLVAASSTGHRARSARPGRPVPASAGRLSGSTTAAAPGAPSATRPAAADRPAPAAIGPPGGRRPPPPLGSPAAALRRSARRGVGGRPAVPAAPRPGCSPRTGAPPSIPVGLAVDQDADLPKSAGKLIDPSTASPARRAPTANITGEWAGVARLQRRERAGAAPRRAACRACPR